MTREAHRRLGVPEERNAEASLWMVVTEEGRMREFLNSPLGVVL
jgi:hypothetical protein